MERGSGSSTITPSATRRRASLTAPPPAEHLPGHLLLSSAPMVPELTAEERRVLGCLIEKEATTPDVYPLTANALLNACNQTSNRSPVVAYDEHTVLEAVHSLRERGIVRVVHSTHNRAVKYRHVLDDYFALTSPQVSLLGVLFLRGPQTVGELR